MFLVIQNMTHHIRTAFGNSSRTYGPNPPGAHPYMGVLQGNGAAGTSWTAVSLVIFAAMKSLGYGYSTQMATTKTILCLLGFTFIDDANIIHSGPSNTTPAGQILIKMQAVLDHWDRLLRATGGALEKSKSYWYLLDYAYTQGCWILKLQSANPGTISLYNDITNQKEPIERLNPSESRKALGIYSNPLGHMGAEK